MNGGEQYYLEIIPTAEKKHCPSILCRGCAKNIRQITKYFGAICEGKATLCVADSFKTHYFHSGQVPDICV